MHHSVWHWTLVQVVAIKKSEMGPVTKAPVLWLIFSITATVLSAEIAETITTIENDSTVNSLNTIESNRDSINPRQNKTLSQMRKENSRFLNLFSVIDIPNTACQSSHKPLRELNGTCYHPNQCSKMGGLGHGKCADGYGVCCFCKSLIYWSFTIVF